MSRRTDAAAKRNAYSRRWFDTFLGTIDERVVDSEVAFLTRQLPVASFSRILDVCCGPGRHTVPLHLRRYLAVGLDRDAAALALARARGAAEGGEDLLLLRADMAAIPIAPRAFDAAICMWQSFGHFDADGNRLALGQMRDAVRDGGRVVLDVYNRHFHERNLGERALRRGDVRVHEERVMQAGRLRVRLSYDVVGESAETDEFEWALFDGDELSALAREAGLTTLLTCTAFDEGRPVTPDDARMQLVLERIQGT